MSAPFASQSWAEQFASGLQESARVRTESVTWVFGPVLLVVDADAEHGLDATALRVELHEGSVSAVSVASPDDVARVPFSIGGPLARWKAIFAGELSIADGVLDSKLRATGDLPTIVRHRGLFEAMAATAGELDTVWQDAEPVTA